jgi:hypothetical protein
MKTASLLTLKTRDDLYVYFANKGDTSYYAMDALVDRIAKSTCKGLNFFAKDGPDLEKKLDVIKRLVEEEVKPHRKNFRQAIAAGKLDFIPNRIYSRLHDHIMRLAEGKQYRFDESHFNVDDINELKARHIAEVAAFRPMPQTVPPVDSIQAVQFDPFLKLKSDQDPEEDHAPEYRVGENDRVSEVSIRPPLTARSNLRVITPDYVADLARYLSDTEARKNEPLHFWNAPGVSDLVAMGNHKLKLKKGTL